MKIRTALNIVIVALFIIFAIFVSVLTFSFQRMNAASQQAQLATAIAVDASRFRSLALEYILDPSERVGRQLHRQYEIVGNQLDQVLSFNGGMDQAVDLREDFLVLERQFTELLGIVDHDGEADADSRQRDLLGQQVSVTSQRVVQGLLNVSKIHEAHIQEVLRLAYFTVFTTSLISFLLILAIFGLFKKKVAQPILKMESDMQAIMAGDLDHQVTDGRKDEIGKLARAINDMVAKLKELDDLKSAFINTAAHQLRTPMTNIRWTTEELLAGLTKKQSKVRGKIVTINQDVLKMIAAVKDLLDVTSIQLGKINYVKEEVEVGTVVKAVVAELDELINRKDLRVSHNLADDRQIVLNIDKKRFEDVVRCLITNAVTYNRLGGKISIDVKLEGGFIKIAVSDTGIGIPEEDREKVFTRFYRSKSSIQHQPDGFGLGLFVSKSHVENWGGKLTFKSKEGKGSTFTVQIPKSPTSKQ